jgi:serine/threonine protein kinase
MNNALAAKRPTRASPSKAAEEFLKFHQSDISQLLPEPVPGYRLHGKLGAGGMGSIYLADDPYWNIAALKLLPNVGEGHPMEHMKEWFTRECAATMMLSHPNVVNSFESGVTQDYLYLSMEVLEAGSLKELLRSRRRLPWEEARTLILDVLDGLEAAHAAGVIHRDLKTENVMLTSAGDGLRAKLIDFGLCYISGFEDIYPHMKGIPAPYAPVLSLPDGNFGTPEFRAPEFDTPGGNQKPAFDIYSAGMILYEMVSGTLPFEPVAAQDLLQRVRIYDNLHKNVFPPKPSEAVHGLSLPEGVEDIVMIAIEKLPSFRFQSAAEMRAEIAALG